MRPPAERMRGLGQASTGSASPVGGFVVVRPAEPILDAAVLVDPGLTEDATLNKVVIATPATLVALLKAVAYGWRQEKMAENSAKVADEGRKLLDAINVWAGHFLKLRGAVFDVVQHFNAVQGSVERNVLPKARTMKELGVQTLKDIPTIEPLSGCRRLRRNFTALRIPRGGAGKFITPRSLSSNATADNRYEPPAPRTETSGHERYRLPLLPSGSGGVHRS